MSNVEKRGGSTKKRNVGITTAANPMEPVQTKRTVATKGETINGR